MALASRRLFPGGGVIWVNVARFMPPMPSRMVRIRIQNQPEQAETPWRQGQRQRDPPVRGVQTSRGMRGRTVRRG